MLPASTSELIHTDSLLSICDGGDPVTPDPILGHIRSADEEPPAHEEDEDDHKAKRVGQDHRPAQGTEETEHGTGHLLNHEQQEHLLEEAVGLRGVAGDIVCHAHPHHSLE